MLKFKGTAKQFKEFMTTLQILYGRKATLKQVIIKMGGLK